MPKDKDKKPAKALRSGPLEVQIREDLPGADTAAKEALKKKIRKQQQGGGGEGGRKGLGASGLAVHDEEDADDDFAAGFDGDDGQGADFLSAKQSRKVLDAARAQLDEEAAGGMDSGKGKKNKKSVRFGGAGASSSSSSAAASSAYAGSSSIAAAVTGKKGKAKQADDDEDEGYDIEEEEEDGGSIVDFGDDDGESAVKRQGFVAVLPQGSTSAAIFLFLLLTCSLVLSFVFVCRRRPP